MSRVKDVQEPTATTTASDDVVKTGVQEPAASEDASSTKDILSESGNVKVVCERLANGKAHGLTGIIDFDKDGVAFVSEEDAKRFSLIPGFEVKSK